MNLPLIIKAEAKLTTRDHASISARELTGIAFEGQDSVGILAVLFIGGDRDADGRWVIVDASTWRTRLGDSVSATRSNLVSLERTQPQLDELRGYVNDLWPAFLEGWKATADRGHEELTRELERSHREGTLLESLPQHPILAVEHRQSVSDLVSTHGESDAGRLVQDLLAYVIAAAGYRNVTNNPVGIPDFVLTGLATDSAAVVLRLTTDEARTLERLCEHAGELSLAARLREATPRRQV